MTTTRRIVMGAAGAMMLGLLGMIAAEASCSSNGTGLPTGAISASACAMEGSDHGEPYTGRNTEPARAWIYDYDNNGSYSQTEVSVYQNRWAYPAGGQHWRDTQIDISRYQYLQPVGQDLQAQAYLQQTDYGDQQYDQRYTYGFADVRTYGALGSAQVYVGGSQYRADGRCGENGLIYAQVNSSTTYTPIGDHDCPAEVPLAPDLP